jgi:hypothetical protein
MATTAWSADHRRRVHRNTKPRTAVGRGGCGIGPLVTALLLEELRPAALKWSATLAAAAPNWATKAGP